VKALAIWVDKVTKGESHWFDKVVARRVTAGKATIIAVERVIAGTVVAAKLVAGKVTGEKVISEKVAAE
jgi:hypothetical protein